MPSTKKIACWMSDKKLQKINWEEFETICNQYGFEVFKLNLNISLESQAPFCVLLHKLTDIIASANEGDLKSTIIINKVEKYISKSSELLVVDPIPNVRMLLDRYRSYSNIHSSNLHCHGVFIPNFCELTGTDNDSIQNQLRDANVTYPFICKPLVGHGSKQAHEMSIIFSEKHLDDCKTPCVAQSFINHNAILYKIFIVGGKHCVVERPSLKNFYESDSKTIYFDSSDVSKAGSQNHLTVLDPEDTLKENIKPNPDVFQTIARTMRTIFGMDLIGIDVVIDNTTGKYAIIDVNAYPGYDGFPNFFEALLECISDKVNSTYIQE